MGGDGMLLQQQIYSHRATTQVFLSMTEYAAMHHVIIIIIV